MKKWLVLVLALALFSANVSAVTQYIAEEFFMNKAECDSKGYTKMFSIKGADGGEYYYCLRMASYSSSEEFLVDSYLAFGVESCLSGYAPEEFTFDVYKNINDFAINKTQSINYLCVKRQARSNMNEVAEIDYVPFSDNACSGIRDTFVDASGKVFYHCQHWDPGAVSVDSGECYDTDGGDVKTISEIELRYGVVLDGDAYGFDPPISGLTFPEGEDAFELKYGKNFVEVKKDYCVSKYKLKEHYCDVSTKTIKGVEMDCPNGGECDNGKCLGGGVGRGDQLDVEMCYDIDSGKDNLTIPAYIDFFNGAGAGYRYYDVCANDGASLFEYFCKGGDSGTDSKSKFLGEESVACVCSGEVCTGEITPGVACEDSGSCVKGEACSDHRDCSSTLICLEGICVEKYEADNEWCEDTDARTGGFEEEDIFEPGIVTKADVELKDTCVNSRFILEAVCAKASDLWKSDAKYEFKECPEEAPCEEDGNGIGRCVKPAAVPECEKLTFNVESGESGNDICKDRYEDDTVWCDEDEPPEFEGGVPVPGCIGLEQKEVTCESEAPQDLRASVRCCWNQEYDEEPREIEEDEEEIEKEESGGLFEGLFGGGGLTGILEKLGPLLPLILKFVM